MKFASALAPTLALVLALAPHASAQQRSNAIPLPPPTGPHGVGRIGFTIDDPTRREIFTPEPNDTRRFPVHVYYPTQPAACAPAPYLPAALGAVYAQEFGLRTGFEQQVLAHHCPGADVTAGDARFPVIFFSHGLRNTHWSYLSIIEDLVSRGNIVVAIDHTHGAPLTWFPDGTAVRQADRFGQSSNPQYFQLSMMEHSRFWADDMSRTLDRVAAGQVSELAGVRDRMDLDRIIYIGHSYGGLAAVHAARMDSRVRGAVNLDGLISNRYAVPVTADVPLLVLNSDQRNESGTYMSTARVVSVKGAHHSTFSDLQWLVEKFGRQQPPAAPLSAGYSIDLTRELLREFVSCSLDERCDTLDERLRAIRK